jgi:hypothetical protein
MVAGATEQNGAISQSFASKGTLERGALVSFAQQNSKSVVTAATTQNAAQLAGVVGDMQLVELSDGNNGTQVVVSGRIMTLVSDINGQIKPGDKITASPLSSIGMKARSNTEIVGTAQADWSSAQGIVKKQVKSVDGSTKTVRVGLLPVQVGVSYYQATRDDTYVPLFLQRTADEIAGRSVGPIRILIAGLMFILGIGAAGIILYSSVSSGIISIGRNPLSSPAIWRSLLEAGAAGLAVILATLIATYLILAA